MTPELRPVARGEYRRPSWAVQVWIAGACGLATVSVLVGCWALVHGEITATLLLTGATLGSAALMLLGIDYGQQDHSRKDHRR